MSAEEINRNKKSSAPPIWNFSPADILGWLLLFLAAWMGYIFISLSVLSIDRTLDRIISFANEFAVIFKVESSQNSIEKF